VNCEVIGYQNANFSDRLSISILIVSSTCKSQILPLGIKCLDANLQDKDDIFENHIYMHIMSFQYSTLG